MPDHTCPHLSPIGGWCRLKANFKCPASPGRVGCPFPKVPDLNRRASERLEEVNIPLSVMRSPLEGLHNDRARGFEALAQPFPATEIQWQVVSLSPDARRALMLPGVGLRAVVDRLDSAVGSGGWSEQYTTLPGGQTSCQLTVLGIGKEGISEITDDVNAARGEALKKAAAKFGVARSLERINPVWVDWDEAGNRALETPVLPAWAVAQSQRLEARLPVPTPSARLSEARAQDKMIQEIIRAVRDLPGGESALRRIMRRHNKNPSGDDKRMLYAELRRTYRELSSSNLDAA